MAPNIPSQWKEIHKKLLALKKDLEKVEKTGDEAAQVVELDQSTVGRLSRMGNLESQAMAKESKTRRIAQLQKIEEAFERIKKGTYGKCTYCQNDIPLPRLEFDPTLVSCINCAGRSL